MLTNYLWTINIMIFFIKLEIIFYKCIFRFYKNHYTQSVLRATTNIILQDHSQFLYLLLILCSNLFLKLSLFVYTGIQAFCISNLSIEKQITQWLEALTERKSRTMWSGVHIQITLQILGSTKCRGLSREAPTLVFRWKKTLGP